MRPRNCVLAIQRSRNNEQAQYRKRPRSRKHLRRWRHAQRPKLPNPRKRAQRRGGGAARRSVSGGAGAPKTARVLAVSGMAADLLRRGLDLLFCGYNPQPLLARPVRLRHHGPPLRTAGGRKVARLWHRIHQPLSSSDASGSRPYPRGDRGRSSRPAHQARTLQAPRRCVHGYRRLTRAQL
jgi:hypothetical protein